MIDRSKCGIAPEPSDKNKVAKKKSVDALMCRPFVHRSHAQYTHAHRAFAQRSAFVSPKSSREREGGRVDYFNFFLGRICELWPHPRLRQLVARGGRRA